MWLLYIFFEKNGKNSLQYFGDVFNLFYHFLLSFKKMFFLNFLLLKKQTPEEL